MSRRISVTSRGDIDNSSDPAASSSIGSNEDDDPASSPPSGSRGLGPGRRHQGDGGAGPPSDDNRIAELRAILPDASIEELRQMLRDNDRASENNRLSAGDSVIAAAAAEAVAEEGAATGFTRPSPQRARSSRGSRRSWQPVQPPPSRPGIFSVGGPIDTSANYNIGVTDPIGLEIKRIEAVSQAQDALNERLGYNLRESGKYQEMEREYQEGERLLASAGLERREKVLPKMMMWDVPPVSRKAMLEKEPTFPEMGKELPLPVSFGAQKEMMRNGGNGDICFGKFVDPRPGDDEDEQKQEEITQDESCWVDVSLDDSPIGPYDQVVRCWKCHAGLRVHIEVGLVACPRCQTISPTTDVAKIG